MKVVLVRVGVPLGVFLLLSFSTHTYAQLASANRSCETPISLNEFYGMGAFNYTVRQASIQNGYMTVLIQPNAQPNNSWHMWIQKLGPDEVLKKTDDFGFAHWHFVYPTFFAPPVATKISQNGWIAFILEDPESPARTHNIDPSIEVPRDTVLAVCHYLDCLASYRVLKRFNLRPQNPYYPDAELTHDGSVTQFRWDHNYGYETLVYSYSQLDSPFLASQYFSFSPAPNPIPPNPTPHSAIVSYDPWNDIHTDLYKDFGVIDINSGVHLILGKEPVGVNGHYAAIRSTVAWGVVDGLEYFDFEPDPAAVPGFNPYMLTHIPAWDDFRTGPNHKFARNTSDYIVASSVSPENGVETIAINQIFERPQNILRDLVFRSSLNAYFSHKALHSTLLGDGRDVQTLIALERETPHSVPGQVSSFMVAVATSLGQWADHRTSLYTYVPSRQTGVPGTFELYKSVDLRPGEEFRLYSGSGHYLIGRWQHASASGQMVQELALVHCP